MASVIKKPMPSFRQSVTQMRKQKAMAEVAHIDNLLKIKNAISNDIKNGKYSIEEYKQISDEIFDELLPDSEDDISVADSEGSISSSDYDDIINISFPNDGPAANKELVERLKNDGFYIQETRSKSEKYYSVKKGDKYLQIINHNQGTRNNFGIIATTVNTNWHPITTSWNNFGIARKGTQRKMFDFKGKNIDLVVQMIEKILS